MSLDEFIEWLVDVVCAVLVVAFVLFCGGQIRGCTERDEAVKRGQGEFYLDQDHNKQFRWITNCPPKVQQ